MSDMLQVTIDQAVGVSDFIVTFAISLRTDVPPTISIMFQARDTMMCTYIAICHNRTTLWRSKRRRRFDLFPCRTRAREETLT